MTKVRFIYAFWIAFFIKYWSWLKVYRPNIISIWHILLNVDFLPTVMELSNSYTSKNFEGVTNYTLKLGKRAEKKLAFEWLGGKVYSRLTNPNTKVQTPGMCASFSFRCFYLARKPKAAMHWIVYTLIHAIIFLYTNDLGVRLR